MSKTLSELVEKALDGYQLKDIIIYNGDANAANEYKTYKAFGDFLYNKGLITTILEKKFYNFVFEYTLMDSVKKSAAKFVISDENVKVLGNLIPNLASLKSKFDELVVSYDGNSTNTSLSVTKNLYVCSDENYTDTYAGYVCAEGDELVAISTYSSSFKNSDWVKVTDEIVLDTPTATAFNALTGYKKGQKFYVTASGTYAGNDVTYDEDTTFMMVCKSDYADSFKNSDWVLSATVITLTPDSGQTNAQKFNSNTGYEAGNRYVVPVASSLGDDSVVSSPATYTSTTVAVLDEVNASHTGTATAASFLKVNAPEVYINDYNSTGTFALASSNGKTQLTAENVYTKFVLKDSTFNMENQTSLTFTGGSKATSPTDVLINNVNFAGDCEGYAISLEAVNDNASIIIKNCTFDDCSNVLRIINPWVATGVNVVFENCNVNTLGTTSNIGFVIMEDNTSGVTTTSNFGPSNLTLTFKNCTVGGNGLQNIVGVSANTANQLCGVFANTTFVTYDSTKYPTVKIQ